jgi:hypothetical protein
MRWASIVQGLRALTATSVSASSMYVPASASRHGFTIRAISKRKGIEPASGPSVAGRRFEPATLSIDIRRGGKHGVCAAPTFQTNVFDPGAARRRDPEEARRILDPVLEHMMEAVHRHAADHRACHSGFARVHRKAGATREANEAMLRAAALDQRLGMTAWLRRLEADGVRRSPVPEAPFKGLRSRRRLTLVWNSHQLPVVVGTAPRRSAPGCSAISSTVSAAKRSTPMRRHGVLS